MDPNKGVVFYLLGQAKLEDIVFKSKHPSLDIIPAGPIPPNPAEMIADDRFPQLLDELKNEYDVIIIDTSPIGAVADATQIMRRLNAQIEKIKTNLIENIGNIISNSEFAINDLKTRMTEYEIMVEKIPQTERNYLNIERKYKLNNAIYTFLLQKLSEAQIAKASNVLDTQVLERALLVLIRN